MIIEPARDVDSAKLLGLVMLINYAVRFRQTFTSQPPAIVRVIHRLMNSSKAFSISWTRNSILVPRCPAHL